uniref:ARAD1D10802p n=1 Tax=Blastobotrys adeninivorans TaxID=409370 RepID=A0A060T8W6_BLAAD
MEGRSWTVLREDDDKENAIPGASAAAVSTARSRVGRVPLRTVVLTDESCDGKSSEDPDECQKSPALASKPASEPGSASVSRSSSDSTLQMDKLGAQLNSLSLKQKLVVFQDSPCAKSNRPALSTNSTNATKAKGPKQLSLGETPSASHHTIPSSSLSSSSSSNQSSAMPPAPSFGSNEPLRMRRPLGNMAARRANATATAKRLVLMR